jgi:ATP-dependent Clp protease ATP-binding subunit ClpX
MGQLERTIQATLVHQGRVEALPAEPGECITYQWRGPKPQERYSSYSQYAPLWERAWELFVEHIWGKIPLHKGSTHATVTRVELQKGKWQVYLTPNEWTYHIGHRFPRGFQNPVAAHTIAVVGNRDQTPQVLGGETVEIAVEYKPGFFHHLLRNGFVLPEVKTVQARVVTQADLADDPFVYLTNVQGNELYVARLSSLPIETRPIHLRPLETSEQVPIDYAPLIQMVEDSIAGQPAKSDSDSVKLTATHVSPADIATSLSTVVKGQEAAVKSLAVAVYDHHVRPASVKKSNALIVGPTGTGKTELARTAAELLGVPFAEVKLSGVSSTGFKGTNLATVFEDLYDKRLHPHFKRAVVFLDEIDKLTEHQFASGAGFGGTLQNELIGWVESADVKLETFTVNTTHMLFVGAGAFVGLEKIIAKRLGTNLETYAGADRREVIEDLYDQLTPDDIANYGMKPELVGRFPVITRTKPMTVPLLIDIMKHSKKSAITQQLELLQKGYGLAVSIDEGAYDVLAHAATGLGTGARGIETVSARLFEDIKFDIKQLTGGKTELIITPEMAYARLQRLLPATYKP